MRLLYREGDTIWQYRGGANLVSVQYIFTDDFHIKAAYGVRYRWLPEYATLTSLYNQCDKLYREIFNVYF